MMDNLVQVGLELFGQQNSFQASGGNSPPVKILHPQRTSELQLSTVKQIRLGHHWSLPIPGCCPVGHRSGLGLTAFKTRGVCTAATCKG